MPIDFIVAPSYVIDLSRQIPSSAVNSTKTTRAKLMPRHGGHDAAFRQLPFDT